MRVVLVVVLVAGCGRIGFVPLGGATGDGGTGTDGGPPRPAANLVFVTSTTQLPTFQSVPPYDQICQQRADAGGLTGTYVSFLSGSSGANLKIQNARGFVRYDGLIVADQPSAFGSMMLRPIAFDEFGHVVPAGTNVMTGSNVNGGVDGNCNGLADTQGVIASGNADATMDLFDATIVHSCSTPAPIYCFEIDRNVAVSEPPPAGRKAFLSTTRMNLGGGIGDADARCTSDASTAGVTGSFQALIATPTASAASRFSASGANWFRPDGVAVAATPEDLLAGRWIAPINVQLDGTMLDGGVLFGADDVVSPGTAASTCSSWTVTDTSLPTVGSSASAGPLALRDDTRGIECLDGAYLYCLEI